MKVAGGALGRQSIHEDYGILEFCLKLRSLTPRDRVSLHRPGREIGKIGGSFRWAGMMRSFSHVLRSKAESQCYCEFLKCFHLPVEPDFRLRSKPIRPTESSTKILHAQFPQPI